jgi:hypothetical protein
VTTFAGMLGILVTECHPRMFCRSRHSRLLKWRCYKGGENVAGTRRVGYRVHERCRIPLTRQIQLDFLFLMSKRRRERKKKGKKKEDE